jgi:polyisoprenoid-binding protein YceI
MAKYRIEPEHSELLVEARSNVHPIEIRTQGLSGTIDLDARAGELNLTTVPRATLEVATDRLRSGIELYDKEIHRVIDVRKYRSVSAKLHETHAIAPGRYRLTGSLSIRGVTRAIGGDVTLRVGTGDDSLEIEWVNTLDTRDFQIDQPKILMLEMNPRSTCERRSGPCAASDRRRSGSSC